YNGDLHVPQYCDGDDWRAMIGFLTSYEGGGCDNDPPLDCPVIGDECTDGSYYIGQIDCDAVFAASAASEVLRNWNNSTSNWTVTGFTSPTDGPANTIGLVNWSDAGSPYRAASYCNALNAHGHTDWHLPAKDELNLL